MNSIKQKLSKYITISISILLVSILLITDISVDNWISNEFDRAMINKSGLLETLISENHDEVDFDFADEFMPEFSGINDPEYFQLWHDNKVFERSKTLDLFEQKALPKLNLGLNESTITNITLPDGRSGRMYFSKFNPQVDSDIRDEFNLSKAEFAKTQKPMELAYAISNESLNQILWFVDIIFIMMSTSAIFAVRKIVSSVVERGFRPLDQLNDNLKQINLSTSSLISVDKLPVELMPIAEGINHFIHENRILYAREKRLTSDIAHELKTPIAELLNLSEVAIKFPHEKQISDSFSNDVLAITERLRSIVNGILLLQKSTHSAELAKTNIDIKQLINLIMARENKSSRTIKFNCHPQCTKLYTSEIAIETVISNLLSNALYYSPNNSVISITVNPTQHDKILLTITNTSRHDYTEADLGHFFEPLWQKDSARTSSERYGLGLAIVKSYCDNIEATLSVELGENNTIRFNIIL